MQQVADQVAIAIAQSNLLTEALSQQKREAIVNKITTLLHKLPTIQLQAAIEEAINAFSGVGGRLYIEQSRELYTWGEQPTLPYELDNSIIEQHPTWQNWMAECKPGNIWATSDLYKEPHLRVLALAFRSTQIRGLMVIPLHYRETFIGVLSIFVLNLKRKFCGRDNAIKIGENCYPSFPLKFGESKRKDKRLSGNRKI